MTARQVPDPSKVSVQVVDVNELFGGIEVDDPPTNETIKKMTPYLTSDWCDCEVSEFLCYPEDGQCSCGVYKHHVHCKQCGGISQVG